VPKRSLWRSTSPRATRLGSCEARARLRPWLSPRSGSWTTTRWCCAGPAFAFPWSFGPLALVDLLAPTDDVEREAASLGAPLLAGAAARLPPVARYARATAWPRPPAA
jgi:hypothetical protein